MTREETIFRRRLLDLANTAEKRGVFTCSDFLDLNSQNIFHSMENELPAVRSFLFGGYDAAERRMAGFFPDFYYSGDAQAAGFSEAQFPVRCIRITVKNPKFAHPISHRDVLGSVMSLGLERGRIGDILVREDDILVFVHEQNASYLCDMLTQIGHTSVSAVLADPGEISYEQKTEEITGSIASERLDAVVSLAFHTSRSAVQPLFASEKVFVNGRLVTSPSAHPKEGDVISVRGSGKFRYEGTLGTTKKGRCVAKVARYR